MQLFAAAARQHLLINAIFLTAIPAKLVRDDCQARPVAVVKTFKCGTDTLKVSKEKMLRYPC